MCIMIVMEPAKLSNVGKKLFKFMEFDDEEKLIYEIRKHPFGLFIIYATGIAVTLVLAAVMIGLMVLTRQDSVSTVTIGGSGAVRSLILLGGSLLLALSLIFTFIGAYLYESNVVIVTSDKLTQILYRTIFDRKVSQLSIGDVQDTTVNQRGVFAHLFNYGTLIVETAGEQQNYTFTFVPHPYEASKAIVQAHEENLKKYGN